jgi:predicted NUDIX family NTP pyrophosphohydrolase
LPVVSAGILLHRKHGDALEVLQIKPGGPFWRGRDEGAWMIPKGMVEPGEALLAAALREFEEELGSPAEGIPRPLCRVRQAGGKWVEAFALEGDLDADRIVSIDFTLEHPPRSGQLRQFPEVEEARWFSIPEARRMMLKSQLPMLDALEADLAGR